MNEKLTLEDAISFYRAWRKREGMRVADVDRGACEEIPYGWHLVSIAGHHCGTVRRRHKITSYTPTNLLD